MVQNVKVDQPQKNMQTKTAAAEELAFTHTNVSSLWRELTCKRLGLLFVKHCSFGNISPQNPPSRVLHIIGDGNCFFRAVSYCVTGSEEQHIQMRDKVVRHMTDPIKVQMERHLGQDLSAYVATQGICNDGVWATDIEILSAASLLGVDILVYALYGNTLKWMAFPASLEVLNWSERAIFLDNSQGNHFDVVISCRR